MRVFQLNTFCGIKSTGRITTDIAALLENQGDVCQIGYGVGPVPQAYQSIAFRIGNPLERKIHGALRKLLDAESYGSPIGTWLLVRHIKRFRPDVIHLHNLHGCYLNLGIFFRYIKRSNIPLVWTLHDCWPFTGHCAYFEYARCYRWKNSCGHCPQLRNYPTCLWLDGSHRNLRRKKKWLQGLSSMVLSPPSQWLAGFLPSSLLKEYPVRVIYNGVNRDAFHPVDPSPLRSQYHLSGKHVVLAVAANWDERKGLRFVVEAAQALGEKYQWVVIGLSAEQEVNLPPTILSIPSTSSTAELAMWYSLANCLANPTLEDNMPMVNLEALACGTPVAVFATGGCPEAVDDTCGRIVPKGDAAALAKAVAFLASQKEAMSLACQRRAAQFDRDVCYGQYLQLYKELVP